MATLNSEDFNFYKQALRNDPTARAAIKAAALSKSSWKAVFQAIEDRWSGDALGYKSAIDAAAGITLTNALAKIIGKVWMKREAMK